MCQGVGCPSTAIRPSDLGMLPSLFIDKSQMRMRNGGVLFFWMWGVVMGPLGRKVSD